MNDSTSSCNLLIVSDMHIAEGFVTEAEECSYGHDAFLYDGAFARFLCYHEQMRREALKRVEDRKDSRRDRLLSRPWRLVLAGDIFDFWDVARIPGDLGELMETIEAQKKKLSCHQKAVTWLEDQSCRLKQAETEGPPSKEKPYADIRRELDQLGVKHGPHRRALEDLAWWTEVLLQKPRLKLSRRERRHGLGTTWQEVVWKLTRIYRGHREFFAALAWFIACGNEVILLKGNHDLELHWPEVHCGHLPYVLADTYQDLMDGLPVGPGFDECPHRYLDSLPDPGDFRKLLPEYVSDGEGDGFQCQEDGKRFIFREWFHYEKGLVYVEHGNQYEPLDASVHFLAPRLPSDLTRIELPWGAFMVRYVYNKIVAVHPFAVNLKPEERIIHWMVNHDLFRILGILLAEFPDVIRALGRAIKQGFRGSWIWGDRSILGLIPRLIYDLIQFLTPCMWTREREIRDEHNKTLERIVKCYSQEKGRPRHDHIQGHAGEEEGTGQNHQTDKKELYLRLFLHLGVFVIVLLLAVAGVGWLTGSGWPSWLVSVLCLFGALTLAVAVLGINYKKSEGRHVLGQILLQLGIVGLVSILIAALCLAGELGWSASLLLLVSLVPLVSIVIGVLLISSVGKTWKEPFIPPPFSGGWPDQFLRSTASLLKELSLVSLIACVFLALEPKQGMDPTSWLLSAVTLFAAGCLASGLHTWYVDRRRRDRVVERWLNTCQRRIRTVANLMVGSISLAVLLGVIASVVNKNARGVETAVEVVQQVLEVDFRPVDGVPLLAGLFVALGVVVLLETGLSWILRRLGEKNSGTTVDRQTTYKLDEDRADDQLAAIQELARAEQRRWAGSLLKILTFLLPLLSVVLLVIAIVGLGAAVGAATETVITAVTTLGGLSLSGSMAFAYWILRQFSAARQRHDPASGFGDLFYRMAVSIADILDGDEGPRYFVFGHDHWADSKLIEERSETPTGEFSKARRRWYVNSGTWLRGYVEEQRQQEVNENHSTFVQIIPALGEEEAPRVLRWNDGANQPERIVRREEPKSASKLLWERWEQSWPRVLIWTILLAASAWVDASQELGLMSGLWPIIWALGWWFLLGFVELLWNWWRSWREHDEEEQRRSAQQQLKQ